MFIVGKKNKKNKLKNITSLIIRMHLVTEKKLLAQKYNGFHYPDNTIYIYNMEQISIRKKINEYDQPIWQTSFPLKSSKFNYTCNFKTEFEAKNYIKRIINDYF